MTKIKLPLRVIDTKSHVEFPVMILTNDNKQIGNSVDQQTAQLLADCFKSVFQSLKITDSVDAFNFREHVKDLLKRAAEAVEG